MSDSARKANQEGSFFDGAEYRRQNDEVLQRLAYRSSVTNLILSACIVAMSAFLLSGAIFFNDQGHFLVIPSLIGTLTCGGLAWMMLDRRRQDRMTHHEVSAHRAEMPFMRISTNYLVYKRLDTISESSSIFRGAVSTTTYFYAMSLKHIDVEKTLAGGEPEQCPHGLLAVTTTSSSKDPAITFMMLCDALDAAYAEGGERTVPASIRDQLLDEVSEDLFKWLPLDRPYSKTLVRFIMMTRPTILEYVEYDDALARAWSISQLGVNTEVLEFSEDQFFERALSHLENIEMGFYVPSPLIKRLFHFAIRPKNHENLDRFNSWLWVICRQYKTPKIARLVTDNWWMVRMVGQGYQFDKSFAIKLREKDLFSYIARLVIEKVGLTKNPGDHEDGLIGYRQLFGTQAAIKAIPGSGRFFLSDGMGL